jgi:hypothetical protein
MKLCHFQLAGFEKNAHATGTVKNSERCSLDVFCNVKYC